MEETADGVHQHGISSPGVETAGFFERQDPLHPAMALGTDCPQSARAPLAPTSSGALGPLLGGRHAVLPQEDPQGVHLP